jgi:PKD repeat protein
VQWDFDNGQTSTSSNPQFSTYTQNGTYLITQIVSKGCFSDTLVKAIDVTGIEKLPPSNLVVTEMAGGHAKLVWNQPPDLTEGYSIERYYKSSGFKERLSAAHYDTTYIDSCLDFNDKYEYQVSSFRRDTFANGWRTNYAPPMPGNRFTTDSFALSQDYTLKADFEINQTGFDVALTDKSVSADSYWWDMGDGTKYFTSAAPLHSYTNENTYTIQQAVERYCPQGIVVKRIDTAKKTIEVKKESISVSELSEASLLIVAPNPFTEQFTITLESDHNFNSCVILDNVGKEIMNYNVSPNADEVTIQMGSFESGAYFIHLKRNSGPPLVRQVIKQ